MAPPIRATNEDIQRAAESFQEAFASFHVVHKLRRDGLIGKGEDEIASRKVNAWLKAQVALGAYVLAGKFGPSNKYARLTPEYLQKKETAKANREAIEQLKQRFLKALSAVVGGEASVQNGGELNGVPCFKVFADVEQVKRLTEVLETHPAFRFDPPPSRTAKKADKAEIHTGCGGEVRLRHEVWTCAKCGKIGVAVAETSIGEDTYPADCGSCHGYGFFDEEGKPTTDKRCRKCLDCNGTGEHQP